MFLICNKKIPLYSAVKQILKHGGSSVMLWSSLIARGVDSLYKIEQWLNIVCYLELFQEDFFTTLVISILIFMKSFFNAHTIRNCSRMILEVIILCYGVACSISKLQFHLTFVGYLQMMFEFMSYSSRIFENCSIVFKRFILLTL